MLYSENYAYKLFSLLNQWAGLESVGFSFQVMLSNEHFGFSNIQQVLIVSLLYL